MVGKKFLFMEEFKLGRIMKLEYRNFATSDNKFRQFIVGW